MDNKEKTKSTCITLARNKSYFLKCWVKDAKNKKGEIFKSFNYELSKSFITGKDTEGKSIWENQTLSLKNVDDIAYIENLIKGIQEQETSEQVKTNVYNANRIEHEKTKSLSTYQIYRRYKDQDGKLQETKHAIFPCREILVLIKFLDYCNTQIDSIYRDLEYKQRGGNQNTNKSYEAPANEFIDEKLEDEIPF